MKRTVIFIMILAAMSVAVNAQFFVEGNMGASFNSGNSIYLKVSPSMGYRLNDQIAAGAKASFVRKKEKIKIPDRFMRDAEEWEVREPEWSLAVFGRYNVLGSKKISFLVECSAYYSEYSLIYKEEAISISETTWSTIGVKMSPLVTYDFSEKFSFVASCDFLSLDLSSETENNKLTGFIVKRNHFGFTGQSTLFRYLQDIRIGVIYHFNKSSK